MRRFSTISIVIFGLTIAFVVSSLAAPAQTHATGLDFWNFADELSGFRDAETAGHDLDFGLEQAHQRNAIGEDIATSLCEDRMTTLEALEALEALVESSPEWIAQLGLVYRRRGDIAPTATDHEVLARYLRSRIVTLLWKAETAGDTERVTALSARLARFDEEACE